MPHRPPNICTIGLNNLHTVLAQATAPQISPDEVFAREYDELFYQYTEPQIVDSSAMQQAFGLTATPLEKALRATLRWYQTRQAASE